ncbi:MAG: YhdH/YhfP family quinone oxidoreductase [Bacterioplanes sp.]|nr:YhdH/YhfP family quinone oxidoreductase [Bacterioplanes sp.]
MTFFAYRVNKTDNGMVAGWCEQERDQLPAGEVEIEVHYSSVNYKDALSANGNKGVTREFPHTPGIDAAGVVVSSDVEAWHSGDEVVVFGYDLGMNTAGGFAQRIRVPAAWVLRKPEGISLAECMAWGTAGFTAALSVQKLERSGIRPNNGPILVTGATGGVGSVAVALLAKLGYHVVALSGKADQTEFLLRLGAGRVIAREDAMTGLGKAMMRPQYQAVVDTVGGDLVSALIPQIQPEGAIATCGMIAGTDINASVFPFILRGISLLGVDSVEIAVDHKQAILDAVATEWQLPMLSTLTTDIMPKQLPEVLSAILAGQGVGRYRLCLLNAFADE